MPLMTAVARPAALKLDERDLLAEEMHNLELSRVSSVDCVFARARCSPSPPLFSTMTAAAAAASARNDAGTPTLESTSSSSSTTAATATTTPKTVARPASEPCFVFNNNNKNGISSSDDSGVDSPSDVEDDGPLSKSTGCLASLNSDGTTSSSNNNKNKNKDKDQFTPRSRSVSWGDISGRGLEDSICFWQDDAPCRCGTRSRRSSTETRTRTPDVPDLPLSHSDMLRQLCAQGVQLESTMVRWPLVFLSLRVLNISYEKTVFVRATFNGWKSFTDFPAAYVETAQDQLTVGFQATLKVPLAAPLSEETEFAICCQMNGREYWDNNGGKNFHMQFCHQHQSVLNAPRTVAPVLSVAASAAGCCSPSPSTPTTPLKPILRQSSLSEPFSPAPSPDVTATAALPSSSDESSESTSSTASPTRFAFC